MCKVQSVRLSAALADSRLQLLLLLLHSFLFLVHDANELFCVIDIVFG
jgi:hypothetical protein